MRYYTEVDSVGVKCEFNSAAMQRDVLSRLNTYIRSINGLTVIAKEKMFGHGGKRIEYFVYYKNITISSIITGAYKPDKSKKDNIYYLNLVCAGLKSHDEFIDELRYDFLLTACSWFNDNRIGFRIRELDPNIDAMCSYENFHVMQIKRAPKGKYDSNDEQMYATTHYMQNKTKYISTGTSALFYDKQFKEGLIEAVSRFELKLLLNAKHTKDTYTLHKRIVSMFDRYAVFYFEDINVKNEVMWIEKNIEKANVPNKAMEYKKLMSQLNVYRLYPNIEYIMGYIHRLHTIRNFKMIVRDKESENTSIDETSVAFDFDEIFNSL